MVTRNWNLRMVDERLAHAGMMLIETSRRTKTRGMFEASAHKIIEDAQMMLGALILTGAAAEI